MDRIEVNVVAFQDGDRWVAQCLEYDIAAWADTLTGLPKALERAVVANLHINLDLGRAGLEGIPPAPSRFRELFEQAEVEFRPRRQPLGNQEVSILDLRYAEAA